MTQLIYFRFVKCFAVYQVFVSLLTKKSLKPQPSLRNKNLNQKSLTLRNDNLKMFMIIVNID